LAKLRIEFIDIFLSDVVRNFLHIRLAFVIGTHQQVRESVEPGLVSLTCSTGELDGPARSYNNETLAMESWWHGVVIGDNTNSLNRDALGLELMTPSR
jgi:hypothetical protein